MRKIVFLISFLFFSTFLIRPAYSLKCVFKVTNTGGDLTDYQLRINLPEELTNKSLIVYDEEGNYLNFCYDYESGECLKDLIMVKAYYARGTSCLSTSNNINFPSTPNEFHNWRKDNWPSCNYCDFYVRIKIWNVTPITSLRIRVNSDDGHWVWINGIYKGHGGGGCHSGATSDKWYDLSSNIQANYNEIWVWCSEAAGGERCLISLEINGKQFQDWLIPSNSIWIKSNFSSNKSKIIYIEEGPNNATDGSNVFIFYDDFSSSSNWNLYNCQIGYGVLDCAQMGADYSVEKTKQIPMWNIILESRMWTNDNDGPNAGWDIGINCNSGGDNDGSCNGNMYLIALEANSHYKIYEHSGTTWSNIRTKSYSLPANQWLNVKIITKSNGNITTFVNGNLVDSFIDSTPRSDDGGYLAIREWEGGIENVRIRKFAEPEPEVTLLGVIENKPPSIEILSPENKTYYSTNISLTFKVVDDNVYTYSVKVFLNNELIYENRSYLNGTKITLSLKNYLNGNGFNLKIFANDTFSLDPKTSEAEVYFYVWQGLNISTYNANGTKITNWKIYFSNSSQLENENYEIIDDFEDGNFNWHPSQSGWGERYAPSYGESNGYLYGEVKNSCENDGWVELNLWKDYGTNWDVISIQLRRYISMPSGGGKYHAYNEFYFSDQLIESDFFCSGERCGSGNVYGVRLNENLTYVIFKDGRVFIVEEGYLRFLKRISVSNGKIKFYLKVYSFYYAGCSGWVKSRIEVYQIEKERFLPTKILFTNKNNPFVIEWKELPIGTVNVTATEDLFDSESKIVKINSTMGILKLNFTLFRFQVFKAKNKRNNAVISKFSIKFSKDGNVYLIKNTTNGILKVSLRELKLGKNSLEIEAFGFNRTYDTLVFDLNSEIERTYYLYRSGLYLRVLDETTLKPIRFDITIFNETYLLMFENLEVFDKQWEELPSGFVTIKIKNESYVENNILYRYPERSYYVTLTPYTFINLTAYLLREDKGVNVFVVTKSPTMQNEPSVLVSALKFIDNSWKTVAQILTDYQGNGYLFLQFNYPHKIKAEKGNLKELIEYYLPTSSLPLEIKLKSSLNEISNISTLQYIFDYITIGFKPKEYYLKENYTYLFEFIVSSSKGNLEEYGMNITNNGKLLFSKRVDDNPSGGIIDVYVNTQNKTGKIELITWFKTSEMENAYIIKKNYFVANYPDFGFSVKQMVNQVNQSGLSDTSKKLIALFVSFFVALGVGRINVLGGGIAFVLALAFFAYFGWFDWLTLGLIGIVSFAVIYLKQYIV